MHSLEVTDQEAIIKFSQTVKKVDTLVLNAGIKGYPVPYTQTPDNTGNEEMEALAVNTVALSNIIRAFNKMSLLQADACVVYMGSRAGQTADNGSGDSHPYRVSKAAGHASMWNWSITLMRQWKKSHPDQLHQSPCVFAVCGGWVKTRMGGENGRLPPL
ncbi:MAG: SDR family NAD(P)-dependent oxidoreductase [Parachlamydiaceae bacterium]